MYSGENVYLPSFFSPSCARYVFTRIWHSPIRGPIFWYQRRRARLGLRDVETQRFLTVNKENEKEDFRTRNLKHESFTHISLLDQVLCITICTKFITHIHT